MTVFNECKFVSAFESIAKSFERIAAAMEKENAPGGESQGQTTKKYFLRVTKEQSVEDRKNLATAIRKILLDQAEKSRQDMGHHSKQQPCPTEHKPDSDR